jgi:hypothetical protein
MIQMHPANPLSLNNLFLSIVKKTIKTRSYTETILGWTNSEELQELQGPLQAKPKNAALENPKPRREALRDTLP